MYDGVCVCVGRVGVISTLLCAKNLNCAAAGAAVVT